MAEETKKEEVKAEEPAAEEHKKPKAAKAKKSGAIDEIMTAIKSMSVLDLAELVKALETEFGVSAAAPVAIFLGALLDGIPESLVIGAELVAGAAFNPTFVAAVFISNLPEAMSSAAGMKQAGFTTRRIMGLWTGLTVASAVASFLGNLLLAESNPALVAVVDAVAGGGILAMLASTMMPEAFEQGGPSVSLSTIAGFLAAFFFHALGA